MKNLLRRILLTLLTLVSILKAKAIPKYVENLLEKNSTIAEYFVCASSLQTETSKNAMLEIEKFIRENNITEKLSKKAVDKIYTRAALNCISKFHNFTREKKLSLLNLTMESLKKDHLEDLFNVDYLEILESKNYDLSNDELEYRNTIIEIQKTQNKEKKDANKKNKRHPLKINQTVGELKESNKRIEKIIKEKISYVETDKVIHHGVIYGIVVAILPTLLCHYCFCRSSGDEEMAKREMEQLRRELDKEGKIYTKEFDAVEKKRKQLKEAVKKKFKVDVEEFLEKNRKEAEAKEKEEVEGIEEGEENLKDRKK